MRTLIIAILSLFIACSTDPGQEGESYPYQIGTWLVQSPETADWVGIQKQSKMYLQQADTINVQTPQGQYITITDQEPVVNFSYIDSTQFDWQQADLDMSQTKVEFPEYTAPHTGQRIQAGGHGYGIGEESLNIRLDIHWICGRELQENQFIWVHFYHSDSTQFRHYRFHVDGFQQALDEIGC